MSATIPTLEEGSPATVSTPATVSSQGASNPRRALACLLCQQRKIKCDRKVACANCIKARVKCVPAPLAPRQRRRRFPERDLLERLRRYEALLNQHHIKFEPLHSPVAEESFEVGGRSCDSPRNDHTEERAVRADRPSRENATAKPQTVYEAKDIWQVMNQSSRDSEVDDHNDSDNPSHDGMSEAVVKKTWDQMYQGSEHLLFGSLKTNVNLSSLHPGHAQIFKLWQIYLERVDPLLKVTHTPTLQVRIIDATSDLTNISPTLEALMFSIYCVSILSIVGDECRALFGSSKQDLLARFQTGCQHALLDCGFLRSSDRDCSTAFYLYLVSVRPHTDPRSLSSMLSLAIRTVQRMGIHNESANSKCAIFEAEMRRRLWWSMIIFDTRICEMSDYKTTMLIPTWDCKIPMNMNDFDLRPEMKTLPAVHGTSTEALFAVVRSELGDFIRHSTFHLDLANPALKTVAKGIQHGPVPEGGELVVLEQTIEGRYLKFCNPENPLHFMAIWTARGYIAKNRLLEHYSMYSSLASEKSVEQRDTAIFYALRILECDTKLMASPLTKGYLWLTQANFPAPAYIHIVQDLKRRPAGEHAEKMWQTMNENYEARIMNTKQDESPLIYKVFSRMILQAWEVREEVLRQLNKPLGLPLIVSNIRHKLKQMAPSASNNNMEQYSSTASMSLGEFSISEPIDFGSQDSLYGTGGQGSADSALEGYSDIFGQSNMEGGPNQLDWMAIDWNLMHGRGQ